jgi:hypothetical protein
VALLTLQVGQPWARSRGEPCAWSHGWRDGRDRRRSPLGGHRLRGTRSSLTMTRLSFEDTDRSSQRSADQFARRAPLALLASGAQPCASSPRAVARSADRPGAEHLGAHPTGALVPGRADSCVPQEAAGPRARRGVPSREAYSGLWSHRLSAMGGADGNNKVTQAEEGI